jgi:hypothetical protein
VNKFDINRDNLGQPQGLNVPFDPFQNRGDHLFAGTEHDETKHGTVPGVLIVDFRGGYRKTVAARRCAYP